MIRGFLIPHLARTLLLAGLCLLAAAAPGVARAGSGPLGIDHRINYDDSGIWGKAHQNQVLAATALFAAGGALWEGNDSRFGHTLWQSGDAMMLSAVSVLVLKNVFQRERPEDTSDPNRWFQGYGNTSFPSGHVTLTAAAITPIVFEYGREYPWVYALEVLPLYEALGRVNTQEHWQSDVLAGWALGTAIGYFAHSRKVPILIEVLPHGFALGWHTDF